MRLPFGLGRRSSSGNGASGGGDSGSGTATAPARAAAGPSRAWASLPPIQRTTGDMPLVAAPGSFAEALPGSHGLPPIVQPLGHEVSALATPGLVVAHARPATLAAPGSIPAPVQRRAARGGSRSSAAAAVAPVFEPAAGEHVAHEPPAASTAPAPTSTSPVRTMPTVSRSAVRVPDRPLTSAAAAARPAAIQRAAAAATTGSGPSGVQLPPAVPGGMRRAPAAAPAVAPTVSRQASAPGKDHGAGPTPAPAAMPSRAGLGEPLTAVPASARPITAPGPVVSRSMTSGPMPIAGSSLRAPVQGSASAAASSLPGPRASRSAPAPTAAAPATRLPELPHLPVAPSTSARASTPAAAPTVMRTPAAEPGPRIRPIAAANPIRTAFSVQRDAADELDDGAEDEATLPSPWWAPADLTTHAPGGGAAGASGLAVPLQRSVADGAASASAFAARPIGQSGARAAVQRAATPATRPAGPALVLPRDPGNRSPDAGRPSVAFPPAGGPVVQTSPAPAASPTASRIVGAPGPEPVVQRDGTVPISAPAPTPPAGAGPQAPVSPQGPAGPSGPGGQGHSERDLDELAQALFGRIRTRLRSDLIHDREAKGLTFDNV